MIGNDWDEVIGKEFEKDYYQKLRVFLDSDLQEAESHAAPPWIIWTYRIYHEIMFMSSEKCSQENDPGPVGHSSGRRYR